MFIEVIVIEYPGGFHEEKRLINTDHIISARPLGIPGIKIARELQEYVDKGFGSQIRTVDELMLCRESYDTLKDIILGKLKYS